LDSHLQRLELVDSHLAEWWNSLDTYQAEMADTGSEQAEMADNGSEQAEMEDIGSAKHNIISNYMYMHIITIEQ